MRDYSIIFPLFLFPRFFRFRAALYVCSQTTLRTEKTYVVIAIHPNYNKWSPFWVGNILLYYMLYKVLS